MSPDDEGREQVPASAAAVAIATFTHTSPQQSAGAVDFTGSGRRVGSATVRWWDFHQWAQRYAAGDCDWPMAGTQAWFDLPDTDPRKWAAVVYAASHHTLRVETAQQAAAQASQAISGAADWSGIANEIRRRSGTYMPRQVIA